MITRCPGPQNSLGGPNRQVKAFVRDEFFTSITRCKIQSRPSRRIIDDSAHLPLERLEDIAPFSSLPEVNLLRQRSDAPSPPDPMYRFTEGDTIPVQTAASESAQALAPRFNSYGVSVANVPSRDHDCDCYPQNRGYNAIPEVATAYAKKLRRNFCVCWAFQPSV
eukprot:GHVN01020922.1.p2 GENE.GHVN01020922.1~~GHVN01020922.1.p2  ORF type:complete len:165 (+),score=5.84 GHVN01020922.1:815-1309(+)